MEKGFFASLFDLSFTSFVTPKIIKVLFVLLLVVLGVAYLAIGASISEASEDSGTTVLWFLVLGPFFFLIYALIYRVLLELVMVIFRIFENSREQVALLREVNPEASARVPGTGVIGPRAHQAPRPPDPQ